MSAIDPAIRSALARTWITSDHGRLMAGAELGEWVDALAPTVQDLIAGAVKAAACVAGREFHDEWIEELCALIPEDDMLLYSNPEGAVEAIILDCFRAYAAALAATEDQP